MGAKPARQPKPKPKRRLSLPRPWLGLLVFLAIFAAGWSMWRHWQNRRFDGPTEAINLPYCNGQKLDLFVPKHDQPAPLVIYIHGGGWQYGSKVGGSLATMKKLTRSGFALASINYRLSSRAPFPAQVQDVLCAVRFLRKQSNSFGVDGQRIGLIGISAGGNLAMLAATAGDQTQFVTGPYQEVSSRVQGAVSLSGHMDLTANNFTSVTQQYIRNLLGGVATKASASPSTYVDKTDPPLFIIHGQADSRVPISQATDFVGLAHSRGAEVQYFAVKNANHSLQPVRGVLTPVSDEWFRRIVAFFKANLHSNL